MVGVTLVSAPRQDFEEHGGELGEGDYAVSQHLCGQPGHSFLPLASLSFFTALRPRVAPDSAQHDEEAFPPVSENWSLSGPVEEKDTGMALVSRTLLAPTASRERPLGAATCSSALLLPL